MSKQIQSACSLAISGDGATVSGSSTMTPFTQVGNAQISNIQTVGFSAGEAVVLGDVSGPCLLYFKNMDSTNFVMVNTADSWSTPVIKLLPGEEAKLNTTVTTWYAKADTAAVDLHVVAVER